MIAHKDIFEHVRAMLASGGMMHSEVVMSVISTFGLDYRASRKAVTQMTRDGYLHRVDAIYNGSRMHDCTLVWLDAPLDSDESFKQVVKREPAKALPSPPVKSEWWGPYPRIAA